MTGGWRRAGPAGIDARREVGMDGCRSLDRPQAEARAAAEPLGRCAVAQDESADRRARGRRRRRFGDRGEPTLVDLDRACGPRRGGCAPARPRDRSRRSAGRPARRGRRPRRGAAARSAGRSWSRPRPGRARRARRPSSLVAARQTGAALALQVHGCARVRAGDRDPALGVALVVEPGPRPGHVHLERAGLVVRRSGAGERRPGALAMTSREVADQRPRCQDLPSAPMAGA